MFTNIGGKIKVLAKIICWVGIAVSAFVGLNMCSKSWQAAVGFVYLLVGPLASWIGSSFIYGFGELIETNAEIRDMLSQRGLKSSAPSVSTASGWICGNCGKENSNVSSQCKGCGEYRA